MDTQARHPGGRPSSGGETPKRYIRAGKLWDDAAALAASRGESMSDFVRRAIEREMQECRREADVVAGIERTVADRGTRVRRGERLQRQG